ncbi:MAG TPA: SPOR domain-containing protein [Verrucomicrobiae bacterium]|nr:SPOR domain-containing protein [Verrucomicrobiae bacterium]
MRNKETGEFELVVGNGFLVSVFFVVILLMAVAVSTGYILGKNSEKTAQMQQTASSPCPAGDTRPPSVQPAVQTADAQPTPAPDQPTTQPAEPTPTTQPAKQDSPTPTAPPPPPKSDPPKPTALPSDEVPAGFFWQVAASANMEAVHATVATLNKAGFHAYLTPGPNNLTRVIVGPFADIPSRAKAKTDLEGMAFKPVAHTR